MANNTKKRNTKKSSDDVKKMRLFVDSKEKSDIKDKFKESIKESKIKSLAVGDFWICDKKSKTPKLIIERKTWDDYIGSLESKRLYDQRKRLLETNTLCAFLIEGKRTKSIGFKRRPRAQVEKFLIHSQIRERIPVFYTDSVDDSVELIKHLMNKLSDDTFLENTNGGKTFQECQKLEKKTGMTHETCYLAQLIQMPNVTNPIATEIFKIYPNFISLCNAIQKNQSNVIKSLSEIRNTSREKSNRFGLIRSKRFVQYISGENVKLPKRKANTLKRKRDAKSKVIPVKVFAFKTSSKVNGTHFAKRQKKTS